MRIIFITNICTHFFVRLFEVLGQKYDIRYYFTGGHETYWDKNNKQWMGNFKGEYLKGFCVLPRFKITPRLFGILFDKFDIVIKTIDDRFALPVTFVLTKLRRKPFVLWTGLWHHPQTVWHALSWPLTKYIYRYSDAIITYGSHVKDYLIGLGIQDNKIFNAPHSIENELFNKIVSESEKNEIRNALGIKNEKVILNVGRLVSCKGLNFLIEAVSGIKNVPIILIFIGRGEELENLKKQIKELNVQALFLDYISNQNLYQYYSLADIFVIPSITTKDFKEPWGVVVNEAMNQGCPVIATDAVGAAMGGLVENGENGFIVPERNSLALREKIEIILRDDGLQKKMKKRSLDIISNWTFMKTMDGFINALKYIENNK